MTEPTRDTLTWATLRREETHELMVTTCAVSRRHLPSATTCLAATTALREVGRYRSAGLEQLSPERGPHLSEHGSPPAHRARPG